MDEAPDPTPCLRCNEPCVDMLCSDCARAHLVRVTRELLKEKESEFDRLVRG